MKLWFADYNKIYNETKSEYKFIYPADLSIIKEIEDLFLVFSNEARFLWKSDNLIHKNNQFYINSNKFDDKQFPHNSWKKIPLKIWGFYFPSKSIFFRNLFKFISCKDEILSCQIAKLSPKSIILPHSGETNAIYRIHLCLKTKFDSDFDKTSYLDLKGEKKIWKEGEAFGFVDAIIHKAYNNSDEDRYIIIIDVLRGEFIHKKYRIITRIITSQVYLMLLSTTKLIRFNLLTSSFIISLLQFIFFIPFYIILKISNFYSSYIFKIMVQNEK